MNFLWLAGLLAQDVTPAPWPHQSSDLAAPDSVERGALDNGLRYIFRHLEGADELHIWVTVAVGSIHERPHESGLAHLLEHVVFRGTRDFGEGEIEAWAKERGLTFGPHMNGVTSSHATSYLVVLQSEDQRVVEQGLHVLAELTLHPTLKPEALEIEKSIVDAEGREIRGADLVSSADLLATWQLCGVAGSYADILGDEELRNALEVSDLREFHGRWYRPERMTVCVAGRIPGGMSEWIAAAFGEAEPSPEPEPHGTSGIDFGEPDLDGDRFLARSLDGPDPTTLHLEYLVPGTALGFKRLDYAARQNEDILAQILASRLDRIAPPEMSHLDFYAEGAPAGPHFPMQGLRFRVELEAEEVSDVLAWMEREIRRACEHGLVAGEVAAQLRRTRRAWRLGEESLPLPEWAAVERLLSEAQGTYFDFDEVAEEEWLGARLDSIDAESMTRLLRSIAPEGGRHPRIALLGSLEPHMDSAWLEESWTGLPRTALEPHVYEEPEPFAYGYLATDTGKVAEVIDEGYGHIETRFDNGVRLIHLPGEYETIDYSVQLLGGRRRLDPDATVYADAVEHVLGYGGLVEHDYRALSGFYREHQASVGFNVTQGSIQIVGECLPAGLHFCLQSARAHIEAPGWDGEDLADWKVEHGRYLEEAIGHPGYAAFYHLLPQALRGDWAEATRWPDPESVTEEGLRRWIEREFERAPITVTVWGGEVEPVREQVRRLFGGMEERRSPRFPREEAEWNPEVLEGGLRTEWTAPVGSPNFMVLMLPAGDDKLLSRSVGLDALAHVLSNRVDGYVREELGLSYGPTTYFWGHSYTEGLGLLVLIVEAEAGELEQVEAACLEVLASFEEEPISEREFRLAREQLEALHDEEDWMEVLTDYGDRGPADGLAGAERHYEVGSVLEQLRATRINRYARRYIDPKRAIIGICRAEK